MPEPRGSGSARWPAEGPPLGRLCLAEMLGTFMLIFFGCGAVHSAVLTGSQSGVWQVAIVWGVAVMLAVYCVGAISGAHINPAITLAQAVWGRFSWRLVPAYVAAQLAGAFAAAAVLFFIYGPNLDEKERAKSVKRGDPESVITAMCYGEYFGNPAAIAAAPGPVRSDDLARSMALVPVPAAFVAEVVATAILALVVVAVTDMRNAGGPGAQLAPAFIGLAVAALISVIGPLTQSCLNPARDFGPRIFAALAGWGAAALPGPNGWHCLTVYLSGPVLGAVLGVGMYRLLTQCCGREA